MRSDKHNDNGFSTGPISLLLFACMGVLTATILQLNRKNRKIESMLTLKKEYDDVISARAVLDGMFDTVYEMDITHDLAASPACYKMKKRLGLPDGCSYSELIDALMKQTVREEYWPLHHETFDRENIIKRFHNGETTKSIDVIRKQDLINYVWNRITVIAYRTRSNNAIMAIIYVKNIQAEKEKQQTLIDEADTDPMTGLYNRRAAQRLMNKYFTHNDSNNAFHAMLLIDVDDFKAVNDTLGHSIGDEVLKSIAGIIKSCFRGDDIVSRYGGDEFLVFMKDCKVPEAAVQRIRETMSLLSATYENAKISVTPTISAGISFYPVHADNYKDLLALSDSALYEAKRSGRNCFRIFSDVNEKNSTDIHDSNKRLQDAIASSVDGIAKYALTPEFRILYRTGRLLSLMQLTRNDLHPDTDTGEYIHPDDRKRLYESLQYAYDNHRADPFTEHFRILRADDMYLNVKVHGFFTDDIYTDPKTLKQYPMFYFIFSSISDE